MRRKLPQPGAAAPDPRTRRGRKLGAQSTLNVVRMQSAKLTLQETSGHRNLYLQNLIARDKDMEINILKFRRYLARAMNRPYCSSFEMRNLNSGYLLDELLTEMFMNETCLRTASK